MQGRLLFDLCYQLDDSDVVEYPSADLPKVNWALVELNEEGNAVVRSIDGLHESVLELDPSGHEMRSEQ